MRVAVVLFLIALRCAQPRGHGGLQQRDQRETFTGPEYSPQWQGGWVSFMKELDTYDWRSVPHEIIKLSKTVLKSNRSLTKLVVMCPSEEDIAGCGSLEERIAGITLMCSLALATGRQLVLHKSLLLHHPRGLQREFASTEDWLYESILEWQDWKNNVPEGDIPASIARSKEEFVYQQLSRLFDPSFAVADQLNVVIAPHIPLKRKFLLRYRQLAPDSIKEMSRFHRYCTEPEGSFRCGALLAHLSGLWMDEFRLAKQEAKLHRDIIGQATTLFIQTGASQIRVGSHTVPAVRRARAQKETSSSLPQLILDKVGPIWRRCHKSLNLVTDSFRFFAELDETCPSLTINFCCGVPRHTLGRYGRSFPTQVIADLYSLSWSKIIYQIGHVKHFLYDLWRQFSVPDDGRLRVVLDESNINKALSHIGRQLECSYEHDRTNDDNQPGTHSQTQDD